jgi:hypothetical protein
MRTLFTIAAALGLFTFLSTPSFSEASMIEAPPIKEVILKQLIEETSPLEDAHHRQLTVYILESMRSWAPPSTIVQTHSTASYASIAKDIVDTVLDPGEPSLWKDDKQKTKTAVLSATMALFEGHYWKYVEDGTCNAKDRSNPVLKNGTCDGGAAYSLWQVHPMRGLVLLDNGLWGWAVDTKRSDVVTGEKLLADRRLAAKTALHFLRASIKRDGTLCEYTGESKPCKKAEQRMKFAVNWLEKHPFDR